jgi:LPXTG-motif cell wall-anchored protein
MKTTTMRTRTTGTGGGNGEGGEPELAQAPGEEPELAPAAERKKLAETGLDPALIAVLGGLLVGGGVLLFRRAFAR